MGFEQYGGRKKARQKLLQDRPYCWWCGEDFTVSPTNNWRSWPNNFPTIEHLLPRSEGGTEDYDNLVLACFRCNNTRQGGIPPHVEAEDRAYRFIFGVYPDRPFRRDRSVERGKSEAKRRSAGDCR